MNIERLYPAINLVHANLHPAGSREASILRTYPALLRAAAMESRDSTDAFLRCASLAYSWMPRALRLDSDYLSAAVAAFENARGEGVTISEQVIEPIAACLTSLVGASKVLHLGNPAAFPMWDKRVERFRLREEPTAYHMGQTRSYLAFIEDVWSVTSDPMFLGFHQDYCMAYQERLQRLRISPYPLTEPRVVQSAAAEIAWE